MAPYLGHQLLWPLHGLFKSLSRMGQRDAEISFSVFPVHRARDHPDRYFIQDLEALILGILNALGDAGPNVKRRSGILQLQAHLGKALYDHVPAFLVHPVPLFHEICGAV